ncbi:kinetochore-associated protein DSN1 homolog [Microcaecilia unicolor]|uniref:Kinetochore-associated protein DSN1 homolog n=1 Tax=Microcaecilia unicolor TaxID=1415580 RepID=A0A6P7XLN7_9AMPH|nr:kinetochore-associated protein DSN1 homolog [Microcaecilia unicolor]
MSTKEDLNSSCILGGKSNDSSGSTSARGTTFGKRSYPSSSPKKISPWRTSPNSLSPKGLSSQRRHSWRRSSLKGSKRRHSLPPVHQDITGLSKAVSLELPETKRLSVLLQSCFQFSVQKLEESLEHISDFNTHVFQAKVLSVSKELQHFIEKLEHDGTLQKCTEAPIRVERDPKMEVSKAQINDCLTSFSKECQKWDQLLLSYQHRVQEMSRQLEGVRLNDTQMEGTTRLGTSQDNVIYSKPDYQGTLDEQSHMFGYMEIVMDELHKSVNLLHSFMDDVSEYLKNISLKLELRSFKQMENSPVRKFLKISKC